MEQRSYSTVKSNVEKEKSILKNTILKQLRDFTTFVYNGQTHEFLGRTCSGWAHIGLFFTIFYFILGLIFMFHLLVFIVVTPAPGVGIAPLNFGKYAYMNYPNRKIDLILMPRDFSYRIGEGTAELGKYEYNYMNRLRSGAIESGIHDYCIDRELRFGFSTNRPCLYLHIAKVFHWTPELINSSLRTENYLPFKCVFTSSINLTSLIDNSLVLPLNIANNVSSVRPRSFPFSNQQDYKTPVAAVRLNFALLPSDLPDKFEGQVTCGLDFERINMSKPRVLNRLYEIPDDVSTKITFYS